MPAIGVTGHRSLPDAAAIASGIEAALDTIQNRFADSPLLVLSSLAEGADRLVARSVLSRGGRLVAVLPLPRPTYLRDFATPESRQEFLDLLAEADEVIGTAPQSSREEAYEQAGRYVAGRCDVLVAVWDGLPARGRGGTAEIVAWARRLDKPVFRVWAGGVSELE